MPTIIRFSKYQGTGNDFILIDGRDENSPIHQISSFTKFAEQVCSRHFGIGSDGLIILKKHGVLHFYMDFYNPDGSQSFCGNGSRCAVEFFRTLTDFSGVVQFEAIDGQHEAKITDGGVTVRMSMNGKPKMKGEDVEINTGSPHYIRFVDELPGEEILPLAREIRYSEAYKSSGINVNFVRLNDNFVEVQTYERGVENETLSCGTGVTAVALACAYKFNNVSPVTVKTKGGSLQVYFKQDNKNFSDIYLEGPALKVFEGTWTI